MLRSIVLAAVLLLGGVLPATALPLLFEASELNPSSGQLLDATAEFSMSGGNLTLVLSNVGGDVLNPSDVLTAIFFDVAGDPALGSVSAVLGNGSSVLFGGSDPGGVVGGEWGYAHGLNGAPRGARQGISSSGFGLFGGATFPGSNLQGPAALDGLQFGLVSASDNAGTGNAAVTGANAFIRSSVVFTMSGLAADFDPSAGITNVSFQYGTSLSEPNTGKETPPVPEPASVALLGLSIAGLAIARMRRRGR